MRYLGIDYGQKRTGLAVCDENETLATPLKSIFGQGNLIESIADVIQQEAVEAVVIGMPLNMDDSEGPQAQIVKKFASQLQSIISIPVYFHDERLSSFEAEQKLAGMMTRKKKKSRLDSIAAACILQGFLDSKHNR